MKVDKGQENNYNDYMIFDRLDHITFGIQSNNSFALEYGQIIYEKISATYTK